MALVSHTSGLELRSWIPFSGKMNRVRILNTVLISDEFI